MSVKRSSSESIAVRLKPHKHMKDSGVEWLGAVPEHWKLERAKWLFSKKSRAVRDSDEVVTCFRDGTVTLRRNRRVLGFTESLKEIGYQGIRRGDLVIHAMDAFAGAIGVADSDGKCTPIYSVCTPTSLADPEYYAHAIREMARNQWILALAKGVRERSTDFRFSDFGAQLLPLPSLPEQTAIARFLAHATGCIERYIRAKEKLIALLKEQKQVIVHDAVTGRIDVRTGQPYPAYKPSGVEWLGDVPEHWETRRLGRIGRFFKGSGGTKADEVTNGVPCIRYGDLYTQHQFFFSSSRSCVSRELAETAYTPINYGDVLFAGSGETMDEIGKSAVNLIRPPAYCGGDVIVFRPSIDIDARFFGYATDCPAAVRQKAQMGRGFTVMHIYSSELKHLAVLVPLAREQTAIADYLDDSIENITSAIERTNREIELVREYRTRLIADVVTGKLDVREVAAHAVATKLQELDPVAGGDGTESSQP